jgi:cytosine deaminase
MLQVLHMGLHVCQLMGYQQIDDGLKLITTYSARTMNLQGYGLECGHDASLVILAAESGFDAVRRQTPVRYSIRRGVVIAETQPAQTVIHLDKTESVDFNS